MLSSQDGTRSGGVAIVYKSYLIISPLFSEFHCRNFLLARISSLSMKPLLLMCIYIPPDSERRETLLSKLTRVMQYLNERYKQFSYGDLNADFSSLHETTHTKKMSLLLDSNGITLHRDKTTGVFTRKQGNNGYYLDYFFTVGASVSDMLIKRAIGKSDHKTITCSLIGSQPIRRRETHFLL